MSHVFSPLNIIAHQLNGVQTIITYFLLFNPAWKVATDDSVTL